MLLATGPRGNGPARVGFFHQQVKDEWAIYAPRAEPAIFQQRPRARGMALCKLYGAQPVRAYPARDRRSSCFINLASRRRLSREDRDIMYTSYITRTHYLRSRSKPY